MASTDKPEYTKQQMEEVWSWVHNQDRCVTTQSVALELGLPRAVACLLLEDLPKFKSMEEELTYEFTKCCVVTEESSNSIHKTAIKLVKSTVTVPPNQPVPSQRNDKGVMYSISLKDTESVETAHERDMANLRSALENESTPAVLDPSLHCYSVTPKEKVQRTTPNAIRQERIAGICPTTIQPTKQQVTSSKSTTVIRKTTTPSDFFGKAATTKKTTKKQDKKTAPKRETKNKTVKKSMFQKETKPSHKKRDVPTKKATVILSDSDEGSDDDTVDFSQPTSPPKKMRFGKEEEKENTSLQVGNADDFLGDEDEDEDFLQAEKERQIRNEKQARTEQAKKAKVQAKVQQQKQQTAAASRVDGANHAERKRKRRKKLVDKTSMDANGYLHTETVTVWEDIPSDEEKEQAITPLKPLAKKPAKHTKQATLMGFFKKK